MPGVVAIYLGTDLETEGVNDFHSVIVPNRDGTMPPRPPHPILATNRVRFVGEPVAMILANSLAAARDAMDRIEVDYDDLQPVTSTATAQQSDLPALHEGIPNNLAFDWAYGDEAGVKEKIDRAAHRVELNLINNRVASCPLETRAAIGRWDAGEGKFHLEIGTQNPWRVQAELMQRFDLPATKIRITTSHVGGGFGTKAFAYPEYTAIAFAARRSGRQVRWVSDRSEAFISDAHGRDHVTRAVAGFDKNFRLQALHVESTVAMGAYLSSLGASIPSVLYLKVLPGAYAFSDLFFSCRGVYTNSTPVDAYRGAGRPEAIYVIERHDGPRRPRVRR